MGRQHVLLLFGFVASLLALSMAANACPFCSIESQTLSEETQSSDAVVLAKLIKEAPPVDEAVIDASDPNSGTATFQVVEVLRGQELLAGVKEIRVVFFGESDRERTFLISGIGTERIDWTTPLPLSAAAVEYVRKLAPVPVAGADRLAFFQQYLEHEDPLLAQDAYDEFARAPYADVQALGPRMPHDRLVEWIRNPQVTPSRRRLYLTMLGVCGSEKDLPMLEALIGSDFQKMKPILEQIVSCGMAMGGPICLPVWTDLVDHDERRKKLGLDAMVACYLNLRGPEGLDLIDSRLLKNPKTEYTYFYSTIMALRFHGEEKSSPVPRERLLKSMRLVLDNPEFAEQVIPDLARWEDWSVLDKLVSMYKESDEHGYVRQPVVTYLTVASEQPGDVGTRATKALAELEKLDPEGVKQARSLMAFGALARARATSATAAAATRPADSTTPAATTAAATTPASDATETGPAAAGEFPDPANYAKDGEAKPDNRSAQKNGKGPIERVAAETTSESEKIATLKYVPAAEAASPGAASPEAAS
ncbi:MAG TPA: hypothetical protein VGK58_06865, partial [Lacipirellulaceae bacterium]